MCRKNRGQGPNISAIDLDACGLWHPNGVQETRHPRGQTFPAVWGTRPLVISATTGQATLAEGAEVAMCRITNNQGPRGSKHCCHRPLSGGLWDCQLISVLVVSGRVSKDPGRQFSRVSCGQSVATPSETSIAQLQHCGAESPVAKDRGDTKNCSHRSLSLCCLWESQ